MSGDPRVIFYTGILQKPKECTGHGQGPGPALIPGPAYRQFGTSHRLTACPCLLGPCDLCCRKRHRPWIGVFRLRLRVASERTLQLLFSLGLASVAPCTRYELHGPQFSYCRHASDMKGKRRKHLGEIRSHHSKLINKVDGDGKQATIAWLPSAGA